LPAAIYEPATVNNVNETIVHRNTYLLDKGDRFPERITIVDTFIAIVTVTIINIIVVIVWGIVPV
jgi:hypothetical protein